MFLWSAATKMRVQSLKLRADSLPALKISIVVHFDAWASVGCQEGL